MLSYITMHSYAQKLISAWAVARSVFPNDPDNIDLMNEAARRVSEKMTATGFKIVVFQYNFRFKPELRRLRSKTKILNSCTPSDLYIRAISRHSIPVQRYIKRLFGTCLGCTTFMDLGTTGYRNLWFLASRKSNRASMGRSESRFG